MNAFGQMSADGTVEYIGQDENNYPIYRTTRPFESLGAKLAVSAFGAFVTGVTIKIVRDRRKEDKEKEEQPLMQTW